MKLEMLEVVYQSSAVIVLNKPGGVLTQAPPGIDSMELRLRKWLQETDTVPYVGVLHRLDRPVSGLLAFGLSRNSTRKVAAQFESREVQKRYLAIVEKVVAGSAGRWVDWMRKVPDEPRSEIIDKSHDDAKEAVLNFRVIASGADWTALDIDLETGRTHQIRLQCSHNAAPILGDRQYGAERPFGPTVVDEREKCIALHARSLQFFDPGIRERISLQVEPPLYWEEVTGPVDLSADF